MKGIDYAYIVRSKWDPAKGTSKQETVKYLGKVWSAMGRRKTRCRNRTRMC